MQPLIDFWENAFNKFHNISKDKINQILSPLYCLEERQMQFLVTDQGSNTERQVQMTDAAEGTKSNVKSCVCKDVCAMVYPSNSQSLQIEPAQHGMYFFDPYYVPPQCL